MDKLTVKLELDRKSLSAFVKNYFICNQPSTFHENGRMQCFSGHKRSFTDIYRLCSSYFDCTLEDIAKAIIPLWEKDIIVCFFCPTTRKAVFFKNNFHWWGAEETIHHSNFNIDSPVNVHNTMNKPLTKGTDGYSFVDIYNLAKQ